MQTSHEWIDYFHVNSVKQRVDWSIAPSIRQEEKIKILQSMQAWQLGETSDGAHLLAAAKKYADHVGDTDYCEAVSLFIKEEQKHGNNLGRYLDLIGEKIINRNWGDTLFRRVRYFNTSMELWTIAVITVESTAQVFYQSLKAASSCRLLKQICTDILIDEAFHIDFQMQRLAIIFYGKTAVAKFISYQFYRFFYFTVALIVWFGHKKAFKAGGNGFEKYMKIMRLKFRKTLHKLKPASYSAYPRQKNESSTPFIQE